MHFIQKLQGRQAIFKRLSMAEKEKEKWSKVFTPEMISSEDSDSEHEDIIIVKPLSWRSNRVTQMFRDLDSKVEENKTVQAKRQKRKRIIGINNSSRLQPSDIPAWAVVA